MSLFCKITKKFGKMSGTDVGCFMSFLTQVKKGKFLCSAVSSPQDRSKHFTLYFPDRPVQSDTI